MEVGSARAGLRKKYAGARPRRGWGYRSFGGKRRACGGRPLRPTLGPLSRQRPAAAKKRRNRKVSLPPRARPTRARSRLQLSRVRASPTQLRTTNAGFRKVPCVARRGRIGDSPSTIPRIIVVDVAPYNHAGDYDCARTEETPASAQPTTVEITQTSAGKSRRFHARCSARCSARYKYRRETLPAKPNYNLRRAVAPLRLFFFLQPGLHSLLPFPRKTYPPRSISPRPPASAVACRLLPRRIFSTRRFSYPVQA